MATFTVYLSEAKEGGYVVTCPTLPGCVTEGETHEEAISNIADAIEGYLQTLHSHGIPLPHVEMVTVEVNTTFQP